MPQNDKYKKKKIELLEKIVFYFEVYQRNSINQNSNKCKTLCLLHERS